MLRKIGFIICLLFHTTLSFSNRIIDITTSRTSLIVEVRDDKRVQFHYYGPKIEGIDSFLDKQSYRRNDHGTERMLYTTRGGREFREPALCGRYANGDLNTELEYVDHETKEEENGSVKTTTIKLKDKKYPLYVDLQFKAYQNEDIITTKTLVTNRCENNVVLEQLYSMNLPITSTTYHLYHFNGSWAREMGLNHSILTQGTRSIESKKLVRATHTENPSFFLSLDGPVQENSGEVILGSLAWSGNFKINFEVDEYNILNIMAGANPYSSAWTLKKNSSCETPEFIYTYSCDGLGTASRNMHDWARRYCIWQSERIRPTLLNSWEGAYFDFDAKTITNMIDDTAEMGLEMFVLDDGWFGNQSPRNNTKAGLGDWQVNTKKLPKGIAHLADYATAKGLKFGIWIEPEMVNPDSDLARKHPEWILGEKGRELTTMRNQWLLDLSNPEVQDFVFNTFDNIMTLSPNISYIKWDANRHLENIGSNYLSDDEQQHLAISYTQGLYDVYERIRAKYPDVFILACASGGGRVEYGALKYHDEVWTSDNTDALSRVYIQYGTNIIYPALVTGSHVSAVPNHQTNNVTPLKFRFDIAMSGRLGMELQPAKMSKEERLFAQKAIKEYKQIRDIINQGDLYRISSPYSEDGYYALMYVNKAKTRAIVFAYCLAYQARTLSPRFRLTGLSNNLSYKVTELNNDKSSFWGNKQKFTGLYLIHEGINPNLTKVYDSGVYLLEAE